MRNILLLYPDMLFYKVSIFNKLSVYLKDKGFNLIIWYRHIEDPNNECNFNFIRNTSMTLRNYEKVLEENKIEAVINILFKRDPGYKFYFASILKTRKLKIPIIFYGHGIDKQKDQWWRNIIYNLIHFLFDGIILYTPADKSRLWKCHHYKITSANNTLDVGSIKIIENKAQIKDKYRIAAEKVILTTGRLHARKKIEILSDIFIRNYKESPNVAWVIVGPDLDNEVARSISGIQNIHFLGPVYDKVKMAEIFSIADIYCVPGALGLGIVEALHWGLPVLTMDVNHGPEAFYLRKNQNSMIARDKQELEQMIHEILSDDRKRQLFSEYARKVFNEEATLEIMFEGFYLQLNRFFHETISTKYQKELINS